MEILGPRVLLRPIVANSITPIGPRLLGPP